MLGILGQTLSRWGVKWVTPQSLAALLKWWTDWNLQTEQEIIWNCIPLQFYGPSGSRETISSLKTRTLIDWMEVFELIKMRVAFWVTTKNVGHKLHYGWLFNQNQEYCWNHLSWVGLFLFVFGFVSVCLCLGVFQLDLWSFGWESDFFFFFLSLVWESSLVGVSLGLGRRCVLWESLSVFWWCGGWYVLLAFVG